MNDTNDTLPADDLPLPAPPCECINWRRSGGDFMSLHHPRCERYTPPPTDPRFARFGEAMWKYITTLHGDFCVEEISEDILPLAHAAGLCCRVVYDPAIHGGGIEADRGDEIWWWGDFDRTTQTAAAAWAGVTDPDAWLEEVRGQNNPTERK